MWAEELRRADERCSKFRGEVANLTSQNHKIQEDVKLLNEKVQSRDQEIARLNVLTQSAG